MAHLIRAYKYVRHLSPLQPHPSTLPSIIKFKKKKNPSFSLHSASLLRRPMMTQCITALVLFGAGDVIAQQAVEGKGRNHDVSCLILFFLFSFFLQKLLLFHWSHCRNVLLDNIIYHTQFWYIMCLRLQPSLPPSHPPLPSLVCANCATYILWWWGSPLFHPSWENKKMLYVVYYFAYSKLKYVIGALFGPAMTKWYQFLNRIKFPSPTKALIYRVNFFFFFFCFLYLLI